MCVLRYEILLLVRRVPLSILHKADLSVLDKTNPYSHFSTDNPRASKFCRGRLFEGALENEVRNIVFRRDDHRREYWNDDEEEEEEQHHAEDDDEFVVGLGYYGF